MESLKFRNFLNTSDGKRIFYLKNFSDINECGEKLPIVFNYGLCCNFQHFKYQIPFFHAAGYPIIMHDYRGHYASSKITNMPDISFSRISKDIAELLEYEKISKVHTIGHSMGVNVSLEFARMYPELNVTQTIISGTVFPPHEVMFDSNLMDFVMGPAEKLHKTFPGVLNLIWKTSGYNPLVQHLIRKGGFNSEQVSKDCVQTYLIKMGQLDMKVFFHLFEMMRGHNIIADLDKIETPTLVMGGDLDQVIPNKYQYVLYNHLPNAEIYMVKDGSHVPIMDFPEMLNERILAFISK